MTAATTEHFDAGGSPPELHLAADAPQPHADLQAGAQTPGELAEARLYGRSQLLCNLADKALDVTFLVMTALILARPIDNWLLHLGVTSNTARLLLLFSIITLWHMAFALPLTYFSGYRLEHRFGLSNLTLWSWLKRYLKIQVLSLLFGGFLFGGLYWVIWLTGGYWWLLAAGMFFMVSVLAGQLVPVLIMPLFYKIERIDSPELNDRLSRLAAGTGLSIEGVYRFDLSSDTPKANAMLAGMGRTRRVMMGDTLLERFTPDEIEVIFAHEIGHHVFHHIRKMVVVGALYSTLGFFLVDRVVMAWARHFDPAVDARHLPVFTLPMIMLVLTIFALVLEPLQNWLSRQFERQCDRYALERSGLREAYISAFQKLARLNKDDPSPHPLEVLLFHSHPPIAERLAMADG